MSFARRFYLERSGRGHVEAGVRGTDIRVVLEMSQTELARSRAAGEDSSCPDSIWTREMNRIAVKAEAQVRRQWKTRALGAV